jgi:16S rRNA processing protein RimM
MNSAGKPSKQETKDKSATETQRAQRLDSENRVTLARILRARGRIGEVAAEILTDFPERLTSLRGVFLVGTLGELRRIGVRRCWLHKGQAILHFEGVDSISEAELLVGCEVQVLMSERVKLPGGSYFIDDLVGCQVWEVEELKEVKEVEEKIPSESLTFSTSLTSSTSSDSSTLKLLGVVRAVQPIGDDQAGVPLLVVETQTGETLIPFAQEICTRIDVAARRIEVRLPEGLRELNA